MPFRRSRGPAPKMEKHEITWSNLAQDASTEQSITIAQAVDPADKNLSTEVLTGSRITRIYLEFHFSANVITNPKVIHWLVFKSPFGSTIGTASTYNNAGKKFIIQRGMEMLPKDLGTVFKRIISIKVPKRYQRMGDNDFLVFKYISTSSEAINACGIGIYKEIN